MATGPAGTAGPAGSSGPVGSSGESGAVPSEDPAVTPGSTELPPASLTDPHEIGVALRDPERVDVAVASGVALLGIGVYGADGAAVRPGRGTGLHDMWVTVEELRGLVEMARDDLALIAVADAAAPRLGDLTEAIAPLVPGLTSDAILAAFRDAYGPGGGVVGGMLAGIAWEAGTAVTRAELWFLLVDAFVLPATTAAVLLQLAAAGGALPPLRPVTAVGGLPIIPTGDPRLDVAAYNMLIAHMSVVGYQIPFEIQPASARAHEGHGGAGQAVTFSARHLPYQDPLVSPNGVPLLLPSGRGLDGLPIDWATSGPMDDHGTFDRTIGSPQLTDASGTAKLVYTPQEEPANGQGTEKADNGQVTASVSLAALVTQHFLVPPGLAAFAFGRRNLSAHVLLQWHENLALELEIDSTITIQKAAGLPVNNGVAHVTGHIRLDEMTPMGRGTASARSRTP